MEIISVYMGPDHVDFIDLAWEDQVLVFPKGVHAKTRGRSQRKWGPSPSEVRLDSMRRGGWEGVGGG